MQKCETPSIVLASRYSTPAGKAMFQMYGVFAEFERAMIRERVSAGLARAKTCGKALGMPKRLGCRAGCESQGEGHTEDRFGSGLGVGTVIRILGEAA